METRRNHDTNALFQAILSLSTVEDCSLFFEDLFTMHELEAMTQRWSVARMLHQGRTYQSVVAETGASSATISRVNRCLQYGRGGYKAALKASEASEASGYGEA